MRCPSCREYEAITCSHDYETDEIVPEPDDDDDDTLCRHAYCRNCDYGVCA